jgi:hypothetical protein
VTYSTQYPLSAIDDFNCIGDGSTPDGDNMATAISTAISLGRDLYIPAGTYKMQTTGPPRALKLLTADVSATTFGAIRIFGDGVDSTILQWFDDIGSGDYAFDVTHADQTHFLIIEDLSLLGKNLNSDPNDEVQTSPSSGYGLRIANRTIVRNVLSRGFYAGFAINGELVDDDTTVHTDHFDTYGLRAQQNFYGIYIKDNVNLTRDWLFENARISINQRAGIACADSG